MRGAWYSQNKQELERILKNYLGKEKKISERIHGLIVPHAGYFYSGAVAGKAFGLLKGHNIKKAIIIGPSHYLGFYGLRTIKNIETPLGKARIIKNNFEKLDYEHSVDNQIPFLQFLFPKIEILPFVVGEISFEDAKKFAEEISRKYEKSLFVFSSDLSHFLDYSSALGKDKKTIEIIENLNLENFRSIDACGFYPLLILFYLCKINRWKPRLIEYKNSGDVTGDKSSVVGYASFCF